MDIDLPEIFITGVVCFRYNLHFAISRVIFNTASPRD